MAKKRNSKLLIWIWIYTLLFAGTINYYWPFLQQNWESTMHNKTCTLKGVICTVCYCTGIIKNWLKTFSFWQPLVALPTADENAVSRVCSDHSVFQFHVENFMFLPLGYWDIKKCGNSVSFNWHSH